MNQESRVYRVYCPPWAGGKGDHFLWHLFQSHSPKSIPVYSSPISGLVPLVRRLSSNRPTTHEPRLCPRPRCARCAGVDLTRACARTWTATATARPPARDSRVAASSRRAALFWEERKKVQQLNAVDVGELLQPTQPTKCGSEAGSGTTAGFGTIGTLGDAQECAR